MRDHTNLVLNQSNATTNMTGKKSSRMLLRETLIKFPLKSISSILRILNRFTKRTYRYRITKNVEEYGYGDLLEQVRLLMLELNTVMMYSSRHRTNGGMDTRDRR